MERILVPFAEARKQVRNADLLLWRPGTCSGRAIARSGRSEYSHAGMAAWWDDELLCLEMLQFRGGRPILLEDYLAEEEGTLDVYRALIPNRARLQAVAKMRRLISARYGWWPLLIVGLRHFPVARWVLPPLTDDKINGGPMFCSQACAASYRHAGYDPVPNLADRGTEPGDLARSRLFEYLFTPVLKGELT